MANYWPSVVTELNTMVAGVWPEIQAQFSLVQVRKVNWANLFEQKALTSAYVVYDIQETDDLSVGPTAARLHAVPVRLYYIEIDTGAGVQADLYGKLKLMEDRIFVQDFVSFQADPVSVKIDVGANAGAAVMFEANTPLTVGMIEFEIWAGEYPT